MKKKTSGATLAIWSIVLICLVTACAVAVPVLMKKVPLLPSAEKDIAEEVLTDGSPLPSELDIQDTIPHTEEELLKTANTMAENFGLLTTNRQGSFTTDDYTADPVYLVAYPNGEVAVNAQENTFYWLQRTDVKTEENRLSSQQLGKKAREYYATLQLEPVERHLARRSDAESHTETIVFQKVVGEEIYSDFEAVKMVLSSQSGELLFCKVFHMPLLEQEGTPIAEQAAISVAKSEEPSAFQNSPRVEAQLTAIAPKEFYSNEEDYDFTTRLGWKITVTSGLGEKTVFYIDAYTGALVHSGDY